MHLALKGGVVGVLDGLHPGGECGVDVFDLVVDEEDVGGRGAHAFGGVAVDRRFGLGEVHGVRPGLMVEGLDPLMTRAEAKLHGVGHVGEDAGADACALETLNPVEHRRVEGGPVVGVGVDEGGELVGREDGASAACGLGPEGFGVEVAAVVGVAIGPVAVVEMIFGEAGDGAHADPGGGVGRTGENHAVVEEDCCHWNHMEIIVSRPERAAITS